jgi:hypothetical protein
MSYVLVTADFPDVTDRERDEIYKCLEEKHWHKVHEHSRDIETVWWAVFENDVTEQNAIRMGIDDFVACSDEYCACKLALQWGPNKPKFYGLV